LRLEVYPAGTNPADGNYWATAELWITSETQTWTGPWDGMYLLTDQRPVRAGSILRGLLVTQTPGGHALITLESDGVYEARVLEMRGRARYFELPIPGAMTPAVTLSVSRFNRLAFEQTQAELRVYGSDLPLEVQVKPQANVAPPGTRLPISVA